jgi:DNA replication protein DnaC
LLLYGDVGTGKTFYAACIVNALIDNGYPCLMTNFSRLTNTIAGMWDGKQEYIDSLRMFSLVAIDDLGVERDTEYMNENVTTIIDSLYRAKVPMIITSNYTPKQLTESVEIRKKRVYDRMLERCHPVMVNGTSRRKTMGRHDFAEMNKLLGL